MSTRLHGDDPPVDLSTRALLSATRMTRRSLDLVVVGNGAAAAEAALAIRGAGYPGDLDIFADTSHPPYNPMLGTYYASSSIPRERCFRYGGSEFYERCEIRAHLDTRIAGLDPVTRDLIAADDRRYAYRKCLVASGAASVLRPAPGLDSPVPVVAIADRRDDQPAPVAW